MRLNNWIGSWVRSWGRRGWGGRGSVGHRRRRGAASAAELLSQRVLLAAAQAPLKVTAEWFATPDGRAPEISPPHAAQPGRGWQWMVELTPEKVADTPDVASAARWLEAGQNGVRVVRGLGLQGSLLVETRLGDFEATRNWLASQPGVARVFADAVVTVNAVPNDPSYPLLYGLENLGGSGKVADADIDAAQAWDVTTGSSSVVIGVIDTGIDIHHPDLAGNIWVNPYEIAGDGIDNDANGFVDDIHGWDFFSNDNSPLDDHYHGTHVAGTIGAVGNNSVGVVGVNWDVSLMALKFLGANGSGSTSGGVLATNYATMMRERGVPVRATNNSWGGAPYDPALNSAIEAARDQGVLFVAAAGNSATNNDVSPFYPANSQVNNVISVAATSATDALASFSNYGATTVHLGAPGVSILSTLPNNGYGYLNGTSMATPHVAGVVGLLAAQFPDASYAQIRQAILSGGDLVTSLSGKTTTGRRLNAAGSLTWLAEHQTATPAQPLWRSVTQSTMDLQIGGAGVTTVLDNADDATQAIHLLSDSFTFMGTTYTGASSLFASSNGLLTFGSGSTAYDNTSLAGSLTVPAIAVYWDDLVANRSSADAVLTRRLDTTGDGINDQLIVEWSDVQSYLAGGSTASFQAVLQLNTGSVDGDITLNYLDTDFGLSSISHGASATVGVSAGSAFPEYRSLLSRNNPRGPVRTGQSFVVDRSRPTAAFVAIPPAQVEAQEAIDVQFSEAIDPATFTWHDLRLLRDGVNVPLDASVTIQAIGTNKYRIDNLTPFGQVPGNYEFIVNLTGIRDLSGHAGLNEIVGPWIGDVQDPSVVLHSVTTNGQTQLTIEYEVFQSTLPNVSLSVFRSADPNFDAGADTLLSSVNLTTFADRTVGLHTKTFTLGSGLGQLPLPGAGLADSDDDYHLLLAIDPNLLASVAAETGSRARGFSGVYHAPASPVMVFGTTGADVVTYNSTQQLGFNGVTTTYTAADVTTVRARLGEGADAFSAIGATKSVWVWGGGGNDTLVGGTVADSLEGGLGDDLFPLDVDLTLGSDVLNDVGGFDTLSFADTSTVAIAANLGLTTPQAIHSRLTLTLGSATAFEGLVGGSLNDTLTGNAAHNLLQGGLGNDLLAGLGGDDQLDGGAGNDTYSFDADVSLGLDTLVDSAGVDLLTFTATTTVGVTVDLGSTAPQVVNANLSLVLTDATAFENLTGGTQGDVLTGNSLANVLVGGDGADVLAGAGGNDTLDGGLGNDLYRFDADVALGTDTLTDAGGIDGISFAETSLASVTLNLGSTSTQVVNANLSLRLGSATAIENLTGGALNDILTGNSLNNRLEGGDGNDSLQGLTGHDELVGGAGNDTYLFDADAALGADTLSDSAGVDLLNFAATTTQSLVVDLGSTAPQVVNGFLTLTLTDGAAIENLTGGSLNDVLRGNDLANSVLGGSGNDLLEGRGGNDTLDGGAGNDAYLFDADVALGSDLVLDSAGIDLVSFAGTTTGVTFSLAVTTAQSVHANLTLQVSVANAVENATGGDGNDTLTGNGLANVLEGGAGNDTLTGGAGNDSYRFAADAPLGSDTLNESGGGTDTLDFSGTQTTGVTVQLGLAGSQQVNSHLSLTLGSATTFENLTGGGGNDSLTGNTLANTLVGGAGDDTLAGGSGNDTYLWDADLTLGSDLLVETTTGGTDTLSFVGTTVVGVTLDLSQTTAQVVSPGLTLTLSGEALFENIIGGDQADALTGNSLANSLVGGLGNDTLSGAGGNDSLTGGAGDDTLVGGLGNDVYLFDADSQLGSDLVVEVSGEGTDVLDFAATTTRAITLDLGWTTPQAVTGAGGFLTLTLSGGEVFDNVVGGALADTLTGNALANTLTGGLGNDTLRGLAGGDTLIGGGGNDTLIGGLGDDSYAFTPTTALGSDSVVEGAGEGFDLLDFSASTVAVTVDLRVAGLQTVNANLQLTLTSPANFEMLVGGSQGDTLSGHDGVNVLLGGAGNDTLYGYGDRDLLIGGSGTDTLVGGAGEDILLAGLTSYFSESTKVLDRPAIAAIVAEWVSTGAYLTRVTNLRTGGGLNGTYRLSVATVLTDTSTATDTLRGEDDLDWFWFFAGDTVADLHQGGTEVFNG